MSGSLRAIGIRPGEGRTIALVACLFAALETGRGFGEIGADTLVVSRFGASSLPYLFVALGTTGLLASLAYGAALGRFERIRLLASLFAAAALILLVQRLLMASGHPATIPVAWLTVYVAGAFGVTIAWTMAGSVFDSRQARRLFPLCTAAAIAGSFVGTLLSGPVARSFGTETLIALEAVLFAVVGALIVAVSRTTTVRVPTRRKDRSVVTDLRAGFDAVARSPLMRLVAIAYVLLAILAFSVTYPFLQAASETFRSEADLATALGLLSAAVTGTSFVVSLVLANRVYTMFGVSGAALLLPLVYLGGFSLWLVAFSISTAALFRFTQQVTQRGLSNAAWSAFYNVVPTERRAQVLAFNDGIPGQVGTILSGVLLIAAGSLFARDQVFWLGAVAAVACTLVVLGIRRGYAASILGTLRAGLGEQVLEGGPGLVVLAGDPAVVDALVVAIRADDPAVRRMAADLLAQTSIDRAGPALIDAMDDPDAGVRIAALRSIETLGCPPTAIAAAQRRLIDPDERVRVAAIRALETAATDPTMSRDRAATVAVLVKDPSPRVRAAVACFLATPGADGTSAEIIADLLRTPDDESRIAGLEAVRRIGDPVPLDRVAVALADPSPDVRAAAVGALAVSTELASVVPGLLAALDDDAPQVRDAAARSLSERDETPVGLVAVLTGGSSRAQEAALTALRGHGPAVREPVIAWTRARLDRAAGLRQARLALSAPDTTVPDGPTQSFLIAILDGRERHIADLALAALVVLGQPDAGGVIRRTLRSADRETRAQAIEALDSIGDRRLSGALVRLLEDDAGATLDRRTVVAGLLDDEDEWIRRLATQLETRGADMPDASRTLDDLQTMLFLRRVPLFVELAPEDLQRIAATAIEHVYPPGEPLVREGELGEELVVIVEGAVRVVRTEPDGSARVVSRYGAGDHIGELAVLREAPRAATVIAEGDGVRGLVIGGESLRSILRERPDAAMAMLATLAERISRQ